MVLRRSAHSPPPASAKMPLNPRLKNRPDSDWISTRVYIPITGARRAGRIRPGVRPPERDAPGIRRDHEAGEFPAGDPRSNQILNKKAYTLQLPLPIRVVSLAVRSRSQRTCLLYTSD